MRAAMQGVGPSESSRLAISRSCGGPDFPRSGLLWCLFAVTPLDFPLVVFFAPRESIQGAGLGARELNVIPVAFGKKQNQWMLICQNLYQLSQPIKVRLL